MLRLSLIALAGLFLLAGCQSSEGPQQIGRGELEAQVRQAIADKVNEDAGSVPNVNCPGPLAAKVGAKATCSIGPDVADKYYRVYLRVSQVKDGQAKFAITTETLRK